jgi:hypothetical protein
MYINRHEQQHSSYGMLYNSLQRLHHTPGSWFIHKLPPLPLPSLSVLIPTSDLFLFCLAPWNAPKSQFHIYLRLSLSDPSSGHWRAQRDMVDPNSQLSGRHIIYLEIQFEYSRNLLSVRAEMGGSSRGVKSRRGHTWMRERHKTTSIHLTRGLSVMGNFLSK